MKPNQVRDHKFTVTFMLLTLRESLDGLTGAEVLLAD